MALYTFLGEALGIAWMGAELRMVCSETGGPGAGSGHWSPPLHGALHLPRSGLGIPSMGGSLDSYISIYEHSQRDQQFVGQAIGLPLFMALFTFLGKTRGIASPVFLSLSGWEDLQLAPTA
jgi:hypothetical protein